MPEKEAMSLTKPGVDITGEISIWPNPNSGIFNLRISSSWTNADLMLYSAEGGEIMRRTIKQTRLLLDLSKLAKGAYVLRLSKEGKTLSRKVILQY
jgi:hypothetical protein